MTKSFAKIISLLLIIGMNWSAISLISGTDACFNDVEMSRNNILAVGILDFELSSEDDFSPEVAPGQDSIKIIEVENPGMTDYKYKVKVEDPIGVLCPYLYLEDGTDSKPLSSFVSGEVLFSEKQEWTFKASWDGTGSFWQNKECQFDLVFEGQQENYNGFSDVEIIKNTVTAGEFSGHLLISKVYYDVCDKTDGSCGEYKGKEPKHEWIELYNPTSQIISLKNWQICNSNKCETIDPNNAGVNISSLGYAILAHDASILKYWNILNGGAEATVIYQLGGNFQMDNDNDMLVLKDPDGSIVDQMNWGTPDASWSNYNGSLWDPGAGDVAEGHMLGRVPVGNDTDALADWHDLELPSVTVKYPSEQDIVWHIGKDYDITWEAFNNNVGGDSELTIDIYYSNDSGKSWGVVKKGTENDGIYTWVNIRPFILTEDNKPYSTLSSHARIKVVATDHTRNFMLRSWDMSDNDFCPPIDCSLFTLEEIEILVGMGILDELDCSMDDISSGSDSAEGSAQESEDGKDEDENIDAGDANAEENDDDTDAKDEEVVLISKEKNLPDDGDGDGDDANDDSDDANDSTQEEGANDETHPNPSQEGNNTTQEDGANDDDSTQDDDANGSTDRSLSRTPIREDNGASDKEDLEENKDVNSDDANGFTQENGTNDGLNKNMVDSVQTFAGPAL
ncbi:hypothetical protein GQ568_01055, partial [Patescibacteria group bacterium]|nr:hypothetical protein [Patescibacteria group bacterium]